MIILLLSFSLYRSRYKKGMLEGDIEGGTFIFGTGACLIKEQRNAGEIVAGIVNEAEEVLKSF